jgi:hypothetical protein
MVDGGSREGDGGASIHFVLINLNPERVFEGRQLRIHLSNSGSLSFVEVFSLEGREGGVIECMGVLHSPGFGLHARVADSSIIVSCEAGMGSIKMLGGPRDSILFNGFVE